MILETENIKFKSIFTDDIYKEVIAFANTDGGIIYIGIDNNGNQIGIDNIDDTFTRITNGIRDAILPDVTMFVKYSLSEKGVVKISVGEGSVKPYYLKAKGLKSNGVFVRQGASSVQASSEQIRKMIKETDGDVFEEMRSIEQNLTFESTRSTFKKYGVEFSKEKYRALGITDGSNSLFTNLALILSDQCTYTIKIAVFGDDMNTQFRDNKEFSGSLFSQMDDAFSYLSLCNKTTSVFKGLERVENSDYPYEAIREALLNAIVHRDYSFSGSIIINVNDNEMEFISIGGLVSGLSSEDIKSGISQPRNKKLAEIFHRLRLIESYGTGIRRIYNLYKDSNKQPRIEVTSNTFKIILPNLNNINEKNMASYDAYGITAQMHTILSEIDKNGCITNSDVQEILKIKNTRAYNILKKMETLGFVKSVGRGTEKKYIRAD